MTLLARGGWRRSLGAGALALALSAAAVAGYDAAFEATQRAVQTALGGPAAGVEARPGAGEHVGPAGAWPGRLACWIAGALPLPARFRCRPG